MTSLKLHLSDVSLNHHKVNSVSTESIRTPKAVLGGVQSIYLHFLSYILYYLPQYLSIYENIQSCSIKSLSKFSAKRVNHVSNAKPNVVFTHFVFFHTKL